MNQISLLLKYVIQHFFIVDNNQISIHSQIKILTFSQHQQYDFNFIKIGGIWILTGRVCTL